MVNNMVLAAGCVDRSLCGGLAFAFAGGDTRAEKRRARRQQGRAAKADAAAIDRAARRSRSPRTSRRPREEVAAHGAPILQTRIEQAGLSITQRQFIMIFAGVAVVLGGLTYLQVAAVR